MTLDLTKPVKFRGLDYEIEQVIEMASYLLIVYQHNGAGRRHACTNKNGLSDDEERGHFKEWDLINVPEPPKEVWVSMYTKCDLKHFLECRLNMTRQMADLDASDLKRVGWTLVSRRRVEMTEGVFDE